MARSYTITQDGESRSYTIEDGIGPQGAAGLDGASSSLWNYKAKTSLTSGYPGDGRVIWNNATQASATSLIISHLTDDDLDVELILSFIEVGNKIFLQDSDDSSQNQVWMVSGTPTITGANTSTAYYTFPVTLESSAGAAFDNNESLLVGLGQAIPHHATTHATGGSDPITPTDIGAATAIHTHISADISDASEGGNESSDAAKLVKYKSDGSIFASTFVRASLPSNGNAYAQLQSAGTESGLVLYKSATASATIANSSVTGDRVLQSPDLSGTIALTSDSRFTDERVPTAAGLTSKFGTNKATVVDADKVAILDSAASDAPKHSTLSAIWTWIQSKFAAASSKTTPIDADSFNIVDSADSNAAKRVTGTNLKAYLKTYLDTLYVALTGNQTIAGNKTFSGQTELTGQAATNSTSAMTRGLSDTRYLNPRMIEGCTLYLEANELLYQGTATPTDGSEVVSWKSAHRNGQTEVSVVQAGAGLKPLFKTSVQNSLNGVLFDGSNDLLQSATGFNGFISNTGRTVFVVCRPTIQVATGSGTSYQRPQLFSNQGQYNGIAVSPSGAGNIFTMWDYDTAGSLIQASSAVVAVDTAVVVTSRHQTGTSMIQVNQATPVTATTLRECTNGTAMQIGTAGGSAYYTGYIFEMITFGRALSDYEIAAVQSNLITKWGIS